MPRQVAFKDPAWTGKVVWVGVPEDRQCHVHIDGVALGPRLTGRVLDEQNKPTRVRYYFEGSNSTLPGLPDWCFIVRRCTKCGHFACPYCQINCDVMLNDDADMCCDGECTYDEPNPYPEAEDDDDVGQDLPGSFRN